MSLSMSSYTGSFCSFIRFLLLLYPRSLSLELCSFYIYLRTPSSLRSRVLLFTYFTLPCWSGLIFSVSVFPLETKFYLFYLDYIIEYTTGTKLSKVSRQSLNLFLVDLYMCVFLCFF